MTDLTPIFTKCVEIVNKELPQLPKLSNQSIKDAKYIISDTFTKDCLEVYENLLRLSTFVAQIKPLYLQNSGEQPNYGGETKKLTAEEKNGIDEEFRLKVHQVNERIKMFKLYEKKRNELLEALKKSHGFVSSIFGNEEEDNATVYNTTLTTHRAQVLLFLNKTLHTCNLSFEKMQRQRYERERQLNVLDFQNLDDTEDLDVYNTYKSDFKMEVIDQENATMNDGFVNLEAISEELLQELTQENQELLLSKENQFKQVEKLHTSMVDIVKLQSELTMHLETQGEQIGNLIDNQEQVELDLRQGNKTLTKATDRNKRGSNLIVATCVILGFLLLFVDYVS